MEHLEEHEMLIQYSEMAAFDFNSEEFQRVKRDYLECKNFISNFAWNLDKFISRFKPAKEI